MASSPGAKTKMSGYLEKKGKMRVVSSWKRYWFVLEDRLLLYYRSKDEYDAISPCKGSINLGPPCKVKSFPSVACSFQIVTRTNTVTLRAEDSEQQKKWMQAIMSALNQNQNTTPDNPIKLNHFRYSLDELFPPEDVQAVPRKCLQRQNTMPHSVKRQRKGNEIIQRLQKIGAQSYGGSLTTISKIATNKSSSPNKSNSQSSLSNKLNDENSVSLRQPKDNIYERISDWAGDPENFVRKSFIVDNDNYSVPIKKTNSLCCEQATNGTDNNNRNAKSLIIENEAYCTTNTDINKNSDEVIYAEPKVNQVIDVNENSVIVENSIYAGDLESSIENVYEDLDAYRSHYSEPILKSPESSSHETKKNKKKKDKSMKKSQSFIRRVLRRYKKKQEEDEDEIYEEVPKAPVEKVELNDDSAVQMLSELQNVLVNKKSQLKKSLSSPDRDHTDSSRKVPPPPSDDTCYPSLPPKTHKLQEPVKSIDEILEDLEKQPKNKVKMLIDIFNETEDEVVLRNRAKGKINRHSDELNYLLNELAKVTQAPIMTPGVTSSLVNPNLTNEEWLKILPIRQRRLSEPDYDIPRPHRSIQLPPREENSDTIPATRFFGPVLAPADHSLSMTPDSLEVIKTQSSSVDEGLECNNCNQSDERIIYSLPKAQFSVATHIVKTCHNIYDGELGDEHTIIYKNVRTINVSDEVFEDSLEPATEF